MQYIELGGFPALTHIESIDRPQILQSYVDTVIFRDLVERHGLSNSQINEHQPSTMGVTSPINIYGIANEDRAI